MWLIIELIKEVITINHDKKNSTLFTHQMWEQFFTARQGSTFWFIRILVFVCLPITERGVSHRNGCALYQRPKLLLVGPILSRLNKQIGTSSRKQPRVQSLGLILTSLSRSDSDNDVATLPRNVFIYSGLLRRAVQPLPPGQVLWSRGRVYCAKDHFPFHSLWPEGSRTGCNSVH